MPIKPEGFKQRMSIDLIHIAADIVYDALNKLDPFHGFTFEELDLSDYDYGHEAASITPVAFMLLYSPDFISPEQSSKDFSMILSSVEHSFSCMFESFECDRDLPADFFQRIAERVHRDLLEFESEAFIGDDASAAPTDDEKKRMN